MSSVDDRIVNMQFNNKQFTQGAADSQKALEGLDKTLANAGKTTGLKTMGGAVDGITTKFSALQVAGVAALGTIVAKATSTGLGLIKSLTIDPIMQGFSEYQTNLNSIQTVMANTGESVKTVNGYMDKLNAYSDQTIYNFSEMARNIGTFTAAGVDLKTATSAIQGIANLAALSGSNSQQASTAMYQLSQAIASGKVGLMDWNSVVNAGMGGKVFQTALAQTAIGMGEVSANAVDLGGKLDKLTINGQSFRTSISAASGGESWLTSDVLTNTLKQLDGRLATASYRAKGFSKEVAQQKVEMVQAKMAAEGYSKAQIKSMTDVARRAYDAATVVKTLPQLIQVVKESIGSIWANSFQIILGDFEQSKALWSAVSKHITGPDGVLTKMGNSWTGLLRSFVETGGRAKVLDGLGRIFQNLGKVMYAVRDAFRDIFPPASGRALTNIAKGFNQFTKMLVLSESTVEDLRTIFGGFFSILHIGFEVFKGVFALVGNIFSAIFVNSTGASGGILSIVASVAEVITSFDKWLTSGGRVSDKMGELGSIIGSFIAPFVSGLSEIVKGFAGLISGNGLPAFITQFGSVGGAFTAFYNVANAGFDRLDSMIRGINDPMGKLSSAFDTMKSKVQGIDDPMGRLSDAFTKLKDGVKSIVGSDIDFGSIFQSIGKAVGPAVSSGVDIAVDIVGGLVSGLVGAAPDIWDAVVKLAQSVIDSFKDVLGINSPAKEMIPLGQDVAAGLAQGIMEGAQRILDAMKEIGGAIMGALGQLFGNMDSLDIASLINALLSGVLILRISEFTKAFSGIGENVTGTLSSMQSALKANALLAIAAAIGVLAAALLVLSFVDPTKLGFAMVAISTMVGTLVAAMTVLDRMNKTIKVKGQEIPSFNANIIVLAGSMFLLGVAMIALAVAVKIFGNMKLEDLIEGMGAMALGIGILVATMMVMDGMKKSPEGLAASILILAISMNVLAMAVKKFGTMDPDALEQGFGAITLGLILLTGAMMVMDTMKSSPEGLASSILIMAVALGAMALVIGVLGNMDMGTLIKGLVFMALGLAAMVAALLVLSAALPGVLAASQAMLIMSVALIAMAVAVGMLGSMDMGTLAKGFIAVAIGLALLILAAAAAQVVAPGLIALGVVFGLMGAGLFLAGTGIMFFATGLALLVTLGAAGIAIITVAIMAFMALLPGIAIQVASAFVSFIETVAAAAPRIRVAFSTIFSEMLGVITDAIPEIQLLLQALINAGIQTIRTTIPKWIDMGMEIITRFIEGLNRRIPRLADSALKMVNQFLQAIDNNLGGIIESGTSIIVNLLKGLGKAAGKIANQTGQTILDILDGIDDAIDKYGDDIRTAGLDIITSLLDAMTGGLAGKVTDFVGGAIMDGLGAIGGVAGDLINGVGGLFSKTSAKGGNPFTSAQSAVAAAFAGANAAEDTGADAGTIRAATKAQAAADKQQAEADSARRAAKEAADKAAKKGAGKGAKDRADKAQRVADRQETQAQAAQTKADNQAQKAADSAAYNNADLGGKGDLKAEEAQTLAAQAARMLEQARVAERDAKELRKKNKKAGDAALKKAQDQAKNAEALANRSSAASAKAQEHYRDEVLQRANEISGVEADKEEQKRLDAEFELATPEDKLKILEARATQSQKDADTAKAEAATLIELAKSIASSDPTKAMEYLDQAEEAASRAQTSADEAEATRQQAEQLVSQPGTTTAPGMGSTIGPSKSVLEDAARAVDRYTQSLMSAEELAAAAPSTPQYVQNVYSPTALSATEVYRQSKNLISASETNFGNSPIQTVPVS